MSAAVAAAYTTTASNRRFVSRCFRNNFVVAVAQTQGAAAVAKAKWSGVIMKKDYQILFLSYNYDRGRREVRSDRDREIWMLELEAAKS